VVAGLAQAGRGCVFTREVGGAVATPWIALHLGSYWWRDGIVRQVPGGRVNVWADRRTDSFLCSRAGGGCAETTGSPRLDDVLDAFGVDPSRPVTGTDLDDLYGAVALARPARVSGQADSR
jgi:hypothetical protein